MFEPPINRVMRTLDRGFFQKDCQLSAARVYNVKNLSKFRSELTKSKDICVFRQIIPIRPDPEENSNTKCILLRPDIKHDDDSTWSTTVSNLVKSGDAGLVPYLIHLKYDFWTAHDILSAIIPEDLHYDLPTSFNPVGHIAHVNLRENYLPYKNLIGQVLVDKNPTIRTAVNKLDTLGEDNEFRVLDFEVIAGDDDYSVDFTEAHTRFRFDFSKVFWNSRLGSEHQRLVDVFKPGEAICDAMAGVGPFAVPAGKKGCFVHANDLNPDCFKSLKDCVELNKAQKFVRTYCEDGHKFIPRVTSKLLEANYYVDVPIKKSRTEVKDQAPKSPKFTQVKQPRIFSHYVMNLPSTAMDFLPDFIGVYAGHESLFEPQTDTKLPMIHCYCFGPKAADDDPDDIYARELVCSQISKKLGHQIQLQDVDTTIWDVRDVAPNKRQFCASFRLPPEVAFRTASATGET